MEDIGPLFAGPPPEEEPSGPPTWGVQELNAAIDAALKRSFPGEIWVRGEIQGLARTRMRRHWYFELVEKDPASDRVLAKVSVALLQWNRSGVEREMRQAPGFELDDDMEVRIRCEVGYYAPFGKLQLVMKGVDPAFTLGQMAANRERILRALAADGLLERNARLEVPVVPRRIGVVTSVGSAAYNDFVQEIARSGLGLPLLACDARVQGADTEPTVIAGLRTLVARGCDLLVLIRGGGSRSDLAGFDSEAIARCIANLPVPVYTGIGHEIDRSVADEVAHSSFKTPTAVAAAIVEDTRDYLARMEELWRGVRDASRAFVGEEEGRLARLARETSRSARHALRHRERQLGQRGVDLRRLARHAAHRASQRLRERSRQLAHGVRVRLAESEAALRVVRRGLGIERWRGAVRRRRAELDRHSARLRQSSPRLLRVQETRLQALASRARALDPERVLRRGYSLTFDAEGRLLRGGERLRPGDPLRVRLAAAELGARLETVTPREPHSETSHPASEKDEDA